MNRSYIFLEQVREFSSAMDDLEGLLCLISRTNELNSKSKVKKEMKNFFDKNEKILISILGTPNFSPSSPSRGYEENLRLMSRGYYNSRLLYDSISGFTLKQIREQSEEILHENILCDIT